ncbi:Acetolactate synthase, large subunit, biosynthetic [Penicillium expansum]|nr:Acetolactate synthase, large subunit, biosynthetic [Penicillium expansum]KGO72399.1 Acetolactate synthase, large subunit, biosynthetic [Penicillium expansum]
MPSHNSEGLTGGDLLCKLLASHNVSHVFGYPGGAALPLFDALYRNDLFRFILSHHEQGAGHMAEGYACASTKPGIVLVTSGPGSSNLVTPMLNALLDGTPMVVICGQVATTAQGTGAFQEIDIMAIARSCTKWCTAVKKISDLPNAVHDAFYHATSTRPGPVLISIPKDIGAGSFEPVTSQDPLSISPQRVKQEKPVQEEVALRDISCTSNVQDSIDHIAKLVNDSERPIICAGHGVLSNKTGPALLSQIAEKSKIPVATTLLGLGCFDETHELALHMVGTYGAPYANYSIQNADLVLVFGARLDERAVGNPLEYAPKAREAAQAGRGGIFQFDLNPEIVGKLIKPTQLVIGDLCDALPSLLSRLKKRDDREVWLDQIQQWKKKHVFQVPLKSMESHATPQQTMAELDRQTESLKHRVTVTTGVGQHQMWAAQRYRFRYPRSFVTSGSLGTMGFGLPAAIGAQIARPDQIVIDIDGDASFCMTMEELLTASQYDLPIKVLIFNNDVQGMIAQLQQSNYGGRVCFNRQANPDFVQLAQSMGWPFDKNKVQSETFNLMAFLPISALLMGLAASALSLTFNVPTSPPSNSSGQLSAAPVGVSLEFFTFPAYIQDVKSTMTCLQNLKDLTGTWPPMRIGGTTQDRATYDSLSTEAVTYTVASAGAAPETLTYGPSFISLAASYAGQVIIGLNRRLDDISNTISAALLVQSKMDNLYSIELGNEPNFFVNSDPIANGASWTAAADEASQVSWQDAVCGNLSATDIISAGVYFGTSPMSLVSLTEKEGDADDYVKDYCSHNYPQSSGSYNLATLMGHSDITTQIKPYAAEISAAAGKGKPHIFGETNSATQGGGGISPTFGAALWILDYVMQTVLMGTNALYFHQGTIGNCQYCWWGRYNIGSPYYGAYFATMALANADHIAPLDSQDTAYAAYAIYKAGIPVRVLLYNSDYYISTSGTRSSQTYTLSGLSSPSVTAKRLTAPYATSRVDQGQNPTVAGQTFVNGTCTIQGTESVETVTVSGGKASFTVTASEALLVYL